MENGQGIFAAAKTMRIIRERGWSKNTIGRIFRHIPRLPKDTPMNNEICEAWYNASQETLAFVQRVQDEQEAIRQMDEMGW